MHVDEVQVEARLTSQDVEGQVKARLPTSFQEGRDQLRTALALPVLAEEEESTRHFRTPISEIGNSCRATAACHRDSLDRQSDSKQRWHGRRPHCEDVGGSQEETPLVSIQPGETPSGEESTPDRSAVTRSVITT